MTALTCDQVRDLLPEWALDRLPEDRRSALDWHLGQCAECRSEAALVGSLARNPPAVPAGLEWRVLNVTRRNRPVRRWLPARPLALAATLAALVLGGSVLLELATGGGDVSRNGVPASSEAADAVLLPALEDPVLPGRSLLPSLTDAELESLLARMES